MLFRRQGSSPRWLGPLYKSRVRGTTIFMAKIRSPTARRVMVMVHDRIGSYRAHVARCHNCTVRLGWQH